MATPFSAPSSFVLFLTDKGRSTTPALKGPLNVTDMEPEGTEWLSCLLTGLNA